MTGMTLNVAYAWMIDATYELHFLVACRIATDCEQGTGAPARSIRSTDDCRSVETSNPRSVSNLLR